MCVAVALLFIHEALEYVSVASEGDRPYLKQIESIELSLKWDETEAILDKDPDYIDLKVKEIEVLLRKSEKEKATIIKEQEGLRNQIKQLQEKAEKRKLTREGDIDDDRDGDYAARKDFDSDHIEFETVNELGDDVDQLNKIIQSQEKV